MTRIDWSALSDREAFDELQAAPDVYGPWVHNDWCSYRVRATTGERIGVTRFSGEWRSNWRVEIFSWPFRPREEGRGMIDAQLEYEVSGRRLVKE